jgi:hypothetical protein
VVTQEGEQLFSLIAQVPLRSEAIQIVTSGPLVNEADGRAALNAALASLEGESNWLTSEERAGRLGKAVGAWVGIGLAAFIVWRWRKKKEAARKPAAKRPGPSTSARPRPRTP